MKKSATFFISIMLLMSFFTSSGQSWSQMGPNGGNVVNIQANSTHMVATTAEIFHTAGNIWVSTNNGQNWQDITGNLGNQKVANAWLKQDTLYTSIEARTIGTQVQDDGGIFRSVNFGTTWTRIWPSSTSNGAPCAYLQKAGTLFFGTISGVLISSDQGATWTSSSGGQTGQAIQVKCFESIGDTIFIGTRKGLFRSVNSCTTWTAASSGIPTTPTGSNWITGMTKIGETLYASTYQKGIYKSTNRGTSWTAVNNGMTDLKTNAIYADGTDLYVGTIYSGIFKSTDGAASWSVAVQGLSNESVNCFLKQGGVLFSGGQDGIYKSSDNGSNWTESNSGLYGHIIASGKSGPNIITGGAYLFAGDYISRIYRSADNGTTWQPSSGTIRIAPAYLQGSVKAMGANDNAVFVSLSDNKLYRSLDWGQTWVAITFPDNESPTAMVTINNRIYATYNIGMLYYSDDNGDNWILATATPDEYYNVMVKKGNVLFLSGYEANYNKVYQLPYGDPGTTLMGEIGDAGSVITAFGVLGDTVYAAIASASTGIGEGIYKSGDNGATWFPEGLLTTNITCITTDGNTLFARNAADVYVKNSIDGSWVNINSDLPPATQATSSALFVNNGKLLAGHSSRSIFSADLSQFTFLPPSTPGPISGTITPCRASSQVYSVPNEPYTTYTWQFPAGWVITAGGTTNSVTVIVGTATGIVLATPSNTWGIGPAQYLIITQTMPTPSQPGTITGSATPNSGSSQTYSVTNVAGVTYNWTFPSDWVQTGGGTTSSVTVIVGSIAGNVTVTPSNGCGNGTPRIKAVSPVLLVKTVNLSSLFLEGLYNGSGTMRKAQNGSGDQFAGTIADQITVELHQSASYGTIEYSVSNVNLSVTGTAIISIPVVHNGSFYITIRNRNSIETVSANPVSFSGGTITYAVDAPVKAYGGNLLLMEDGKYVIYGADVNQDGIVDGGDMSNVDNSAAAFSAGYIPDDCNGDGLVDGTDMSVSDNNAAAFVGAVLP